MLTVSPVRSLGQRFLESLRVQKLAVLPVGDGVFLTGQSNTPGKALTQLISDTFVMTLKPGPPVKVADLATARGYVGFPVEQLNGLGNASGVAIEDQGAFQVTLSTDKIRAVLAEAGRQDIDIPDSINGSMVAVHVSKGVRADYGNCQTGDGSCIHFMQVPVPEVSTPAGLNMAELAKAGLQLTGLTAADAERVASTVDWTSTLVIPIPQNQATYQTVPVDGGQGMLIQWAPKQPGAAASYELVWMKNGVIRCLDGRGDSSLALAVSAEPQS